jgi:hypothetical protein
LPVALIEYGVVAMAASKWDSLDYSTCIPDWEIIG